MPIPKPAEGQKQQDFISVCMADGAMEEYDPKQRAAICYQAWVDRDKSATKLSAGEASNLIFAVGVDQGWQASGTSVKDDKGVLYQRFVKAVIRRGEFYKESTGEKYVVTPRLLSHWVDTFAEMRERGIDVWIPRSHEDAYVSDHNRGWVDDFFVADDVLYMACRIIGDEKEAGKIVARSRHVSIGSPAEFVGDDKHRYVQPIQHVALCPDPVVSGLTGFEKIAASRGGEVGSMKWDEIAKTIGADNLSDDNAAEKIDAAFTALSVQVFELEKKATKMSADADNKKKKPEDNEKPPTFVVSDIQLSTIANAMATQLDGLVERGRVTSAVAKMLDAAFIGEKRAVLLSTLSGKGEATISFDNVVQLLSANDPVKLKEQTGPQLLELSDDLKGDGENPLIASAKAMAEAAK